MRHEGSKRYRSMYSLIVIPNDKLMSVSAAVTLDEAFRGATTCATARAGIAEIISCPGMINGDSPTRAVMARDGYGVMVRES